MTPEGLTSTALARRLTAAVSPDWLCDQARRGRLMAGGGAA